MRRAHDQLLKRLRRIEGQVGGIQRMVDEERYWIDVLSQISAVQAALDKVALGLLDDHAHHCVIGAEDDERDEKTEELMGRRRQADATRLIVLPPHAQDPRAIRMTDPARRSIVS